MNELIIFRGFFSTGTIGNSAVQNFWYFKTYKNSCRLQCMNNSRTIIFFIDFYDSNCFSFDANGNSATQKCRYRIAFENNFRFLFIIQDHFISRIFFHLVQMGIQLYKNVPVSPRSKTPLGYFAWIICEPLYFRGFLFPRSGFLLIW